MIDTEVENIQKKENKFIRIFAIISIVIFVFAFYLFMTSSINVRDNSAKEFEEQGAVFYTLNLANPFNVFGNIDIIIFIIILIIIGIIILTTFIILLFLKIKKIKIEKQNIAANVNSYDEKIGTLASDKFSYYNNKVLELLDEGNELLNKKQYADARITYHKIRRWYNFHDDVGKEIYLKILKYYERIVREEI